VSEVQILSPRPFLPIFNDKLHNTIVLSNRRGAWYHIY